MQIEYKKQRNYVFSLIRKTKRNYIKNKVENCGNDSKKLWQTLSTIVPTNKTINKIKLQNTINETELKAEEFN